MCVFFFVCETCLRFLKTHQIKEAICETYRSTQAVQYVFRRFVNNMQINTICKSVYTTTLLYWQSPGGCFDLIKLLWSVKFRAERNSQKNSR